MASHLSFEGNLITPQKKRAPIWGWSESRKSEKLEKPLPKILASFLGHSPHHCLENHGNITLSPMDVQTHIPQRPFPAENSSAFSTELWWFSPQPPARTWVFVGWEGPGRAITPPSHLILNKKSLSSLFEYSSLFPKDDPSHFIKWALLREGFWLENSYAVQLPALTTRFGSC